MTNSSTSQFHDARNPRLLSYSGISTYQTCRHRWKLQNVYGLKTTLQTRPMDIGSATHAGIEHMLKGQGTAAEGINVWINEALSKLPINDDGTEIDANVYDHLDDVRWTAYETAARIQKEIHRLGLKTATFPELEGQLPVELEIVRPMLGWDGFACHIDWIAVDGLGRVWVVDFKVRSSFYDEDSEDVNLQNAIYQKVVEDTFGTTVAGTLTFQVRSDRAKKPKVNKNGTISKAAIVCDWETYKQAVLEAGQKPDDYLDMRDKLSLVEFTRVLKATRSREYLKNVWDTIVRPLALEMSRARDRAMSDDSADRLVANRQLQRNLSNRTCNGCNVRDVCLHSLKGWDVRTPLSRFKYRNDIVSVAIEEGTL